MDERRYFATINHLLLTTFELGNGVGCYCLAFAEALHQEFGEMPSSEVMQRFAACGTVADGIALYAAFRLEWRRKA